MLSLCSCFGQAAHTHRRMILFLPPASRRRIFVLSCMIHRVTVQENRGLVRTSRDALHRTVLAIKKDNTKLSVKRERHIKINKIYIHGSISVFAQLCRRAGCWIPFDPVEATGNATDEKEKGKVCHAEDETSGASRFYWTASLCGKMEEFDMQFWHCNCSFPLAAACLMFRFTSIP